MPTNASALALLGAEPCQGFITQLVSKCSQGDEAALGDLFDLTYFIVVATMSRDPLMSARLDREIVEAYKRIWRRSVSYQPARQGVLAWVLDQALDAEESAPDRASLGSGS